MRFGIRQKTDLPCKDFMYTVFKTLETALPGGSVTDRCFKCIEYSFSKEIPKNAISMQPLGTNTLNIDVKEQNQKWLTNTKDVLRSEELLLIAIRRVVSQSRTQNTNITQCSLVLFPHIYIYIRCEIRLVGICAHPVEKTRLGGRHSV